MPGTYETYGPKRRNFRRLLAITGSAAVTMLPAFTVESAALAETQPKLTPVGQKLNKRAGREASALLQKITKLSSAVKAISSTDGSPGTKLTDLTYLVNYIPDQPLDAGKGEKQYSFRAIVPVTPEDQVVSKEMRSLTIQEVTRGTGEGINLVFAQDPLNHTWKIGEVATSATGSETIAHPRLNHIVNQANHIISEAAEIHSPAQSIPLSQ